MIKPSIPIYNKKDIPKAIVPAPTYSGTRRLYAPFSILESPLTLAEYYYWYVEEPTPENKIKINHKLFEKRRRERGIRSFFYVDIGEE